MNFRPAKCDFTCVFLLLPCLLFFSGRGCTDYKITQQRIFSSDRIGGRLKDAGQKRKYAQGDTV